MTVLVPDVDQSKQPYRFTPLNVCYCAYVCLYAFLDSFLEQESDGLIGRFKEGNTTHMLRLVNKSPVWNESMHVLSAFRPAHMLDFLCFAFERHTVIRPQLLRPSHHGLRQELPDHRRARP